MVIIFSVNGVGLFYETSLKSELYAFEAVVSCSFLIKHCIGAL